LQLGPVGLEPIFEAVHLRQAAHPHALGHHLVHVGGDLGLALGSALVEIGLHALQRLVLFFERAHRSSNACLAASSAFSRISRTVWSRYGGTHPVYLF